MLSGLAWVKKQKFELCFGELGAFEGWYKDPKNNYQIYGQINDPGPKVNTSELHFKCSFQGYLTRACLSHAAKYLDIWLFGCVQLTWPSGVSMKRTAQRR